MDRLGGDIRQLLLVVHHAGVNQHADVYALQSLHKPLVVDQLLDLLPVPRLQCFRAQCQDGRKQVAKVVHHRLEFGHCLVARKGATTHHSGFVEFGHLNSRVEVEVVSAYFSYILEVQLNVQ